MMNPQLLKLNILSPSIENKCYNIQKKIKPDVAHPGLFLNKNVLN